MNTISDNRLIYVGFKYSRFCILFFAVLFLSVVFQNNAIAQYEELPDRFESQVASSSDDWLGVYAFQPRRHYSDFKFYIPPGTIRINFFFTSRSVAMNGPQIYLSSRIGGIPTATRAQFEKSEDSLPNVHAISRSALLSDLEPPMGYMAKRIQSSGDRVWIVSDLNSDGVLLDSYKKDGAWVYVNLLDKNGNNSVQILSVSGRIKVNPEIYNAWWESMDFSAPQIPEPPEPTFDFSISPSFETNAELGQSYTADVSFLHFDEAKDISISGGGGEYRINAGDYTSESGRIQPEQRVTVRLTSSSDYSRTVRTTLTIGGISKNFQVTTKPDPENVVQIIYFDPPHKAGQPKNTWVESSEIEVVADASISISGAGGEYKINNGSYTSIPGTAEIGDKVRVRLKSSTQDYASVRTTLYIGSATGVFTVSTRPAGSGGEDGGGGGGGIFPDLCALWPSLPQCNGEVPGDPEPEPNPEKEVHIKIQEKKFNIKEISSQGRNWSESLEMILELPDSWLENDGQGNIYMFGLLDIPGRGQYMAQRGIFENVFLFPYRENDPLVPFKIEILNGERTIQANPFASLQEWEYTAEDLAELGAGFFVALVSDLNWSDWLGGSFRFKTDSGRSNVQALPPPFLGLVGDGRSGSGDDPLSQVDPLIVEAGFLEFQKNLLEIGDNTDSQLLRLDIRLSPGWEDMNGHNFDETNLSKNIDWSVFALVVAKNRHDQQFLARSDIHGEPRMIHLKANTPVRPATWSKAFSAGSGFVDLFPCIDDLELTARDFARLGLDFYVALVPEGNWNHFFGVHFTFQE